MDIKVLIATHKKYDMPSDDVYIPVHVGKENKQDLGYVGDNTGENISLKNPNYCELTAMYWGWKNLDCEYTGLVHYRRHFCNSTFYFGIGNKKKRILKKEKMESLLCNYDMILPKKRNYWIETLFSHYEHSHNGKDLLKTRKIIQAAHPQYLHAFDKVMKRKKAHMFNMFIARKDISDSYSEWLFDILFRLEKEIDISHYSPYEARVFGYISELLFDVWLEVNQVNYVELPVMFMEKQNWFIKGYIFLKRKFSSKNEVNRSLYQS